MKRERSGIFASVKTQALVWTMVHTFKEQHVEKITVDTQSFCFPILLGGPFFKRNVFQGLQGLRRLFFLLCRHEQLCGI